MGLVERVLEPHEVLAPHIRLFERAHLDACPQRDAAIVPGFDAGDVQVFEDLRTEHRVGTQLRARLAHDLDHRRDVLFERDDHIDHRVRECSARARDYADLAVRHVVHVAFIVAQLHVAQRQVFDQAALARHFDHVALPDLVFREQEKPAEEILDQRLRTKSDRDARYAGGGEERKDGNAQRVEYRERRDAR